LLLKGLRYDRMLWYVGYGMAAALGVYTHLSMFFWS